MAVERTEPLLFHEALNLMPKNQLLLQEDRKRDIDIKHFPFVETIKRNIFELVFLQPFMFFKFLILEQVSKYCKIVFSGIFLKNVRDEHPFEI